MQPHLRSPLPRRGFLKAGAAATAAALLGPSFWRSAVSVASTSGGPYGPYSPVPDANGLLLPEGFTSRIVAHSSAPVPGTSFVRPIFPDGSATFPRPDGGWVLVTNSESPPPVDQLPGSQRSGGASAIVFAADGTIVDAYSVLDDTRSNCAGGTTPWGTWLSCEEFDIGPGNRGLVWECDPSGATPGVARPAMGAFKHEAAAVDPLGGHVYLTEDQKDGLFYRFAPSSPGDLSAGALEAAAVGAGGAVTWLPVPDPSAAVTATRHQVAGATVFNGGEGCFYDAGTVWVSTKGDNRIWAYDIATSAISVVYDPATSGNPVLRGVDTLAVAHRSGDVFVAEDGGNMEVVLITPDGTVAPFARCTGVQHGTDGLLPDGQPDTGSVPRIASEVSGLAFSPDGTRLYFNSQRADFVGITYEVTGPFRTTRP